MHCFEWTSHVSVHANLKVPIGETRTTFNSLGRWPVDQETLIMDVNTGITPIYCKNFHCLAAYPSTERLRGSTLRKNPELEPLRQFVVVSNLVLAAPATAQVPNVTACCSFGSTSDVQRGGHAAWTTFCPPYLPAQAKILPSNAGEVESQPIHWRGHSSYAYGADITRGAIVTGMTNLI